MFDPVPRNICRCCANQPRAQVRASQRRSHFSSRASSREAGKEVRSPQRHRDFQEHVEEGHPAASLHPLHCVSPADCEVPRPSSPQSKVRSSHEGAIRSPGYGARPSLRFSIRFHSQCSGLRYRSGGPCRDGRRSRFSHGRQRRQPTRHASGWRNGTLRRGPDRFLECPPRLRPLCSPRNSRFSRAPERAR